MTLESKCLLAKQCKKAGVEGRCDNFCFAYTKLHGESGRGGLWGVAEVPLAYASVMAHNLPFKKDNPAAHAAVTKYTSGIISNVEKGKGFYFFSIPNETNPKGTGTGKTTAAVALLNEYLVARVIQHIKKERVIDEIPALFVNVSKFQNTFNKQFRGARDIQEEASRKYYTLKDRMIMVDLLVLDDIGIRESTEAFTNEFYEVVDERVVEQRATILTSNVPLQTIGRLLDERIVSRIEGSTIPISFEGEDKRKGGLF